MDPFEILPDIELEELCKTWDNRTLLNASAASSRIYQICMEERERRKKIYLDEVKKLKKEAEIIYDKLLIASSIQFKKEIDGIEIWLTFSTYGSKIYISQIVDPEEAATRVTWIVNPDTLFTSIANRGVYADEIQTKDIIVKALKQGYILLDDVEYL